MIERMENVNPRVKYNATNEIFSDVCCSEWIFFGGERDDGGGGSAQPEVQTVQTRM